MRAVTVLLAFLGPMTPLAAQTPAKRPIDFQIDSFMLNYLEQLADTTMLETARCIIGYYVPATDSASRMVVLSAATETPWLIKAQTDTSVFWDMYHCSPQTIALWHAHPKATARRIDDFAWRTCGISETDVRMLLKRELPPLQLISVQRKLSCLFVRVDGEPRQIPIQR